MKNIQEQYDNIQQQYDVIVSIVTSRTNKAYAIKHLFPSYFTVEACRIMFAYILNNRVSQIQQIKQYLKTVGYCDDAIVMLDNARKVKFKEFVNIVQAIRENGVRAEIKHDLEYLAKLLDDHEHSLGEICTRISLLILRYAY